MEPTISREVGGLRFRGGRIAPALLMISLLIAGLAMTGCASVPDIMNSWVGKSEAALIQAWGPPTSRAPDGSGGHILIYSTYRDFGQQPGTVTVDQNGNAQYTQPQNIGYNAVRQFYVHADGTIYYWRAQGY